MAQGMGFRSPISDFASGTCMDRFRAFLWKKCIPVRFCGNLHVEHSGYHRGTRSINIEKIILQPFRSVKIDAFSYSSHQNWMRTRGDRICKKNSPNFSLVGGFPYCVLYMYCWELSKKGKISSKSSFSKLDLLGWVC